MARQPATPWPTTPGSVFFGDVANVATLSRAVKDGRIRRLARGLYSADLRADPAELVARNRWAIIARLVPDALIADRSAAEGGMPVAGVLTVVSEQRKEPLELPGLVIAPRRGPGPLGDDLGWAAGLHLTSEARTLVDNLAISRGRAGRLARTLARAELEDWVVRTAPRRPDGWLPTLRARALEVCDELGTSERRPQVEDLIGAAAGTREARSGAGRLLAARAAGHEYDPDRVARGFRRLDDLPPGFARAAFELFLISEVHPYDDGNGRVARAAMSAELTAAGQARIVVPIVFRNEYHSALRALSRQGRMDLYVRALAYAWRWTAGMPWHDRAAVDGDLVATNALIDSTDAEQSGVRLELL